MALLIPSFWIQHLSPSQVPVVAITTLGLISSLDGGLNERIHIKHVAQGWLIVRPQQILALVIVVNTK